MSHPINKNMIITTTTTTGKTRRVQQQQQQHAQQQQQLQDIVHMPAECIAQDVTLDNTDNSIPTGSYAKCMAIIGADAMRDQKLKEKLLQAQDTAVESIATLRALVRQMQTVLQGNDIDESTVVRIDVPLQLAKTDVMAVVTNSPRLQQQHATTHTAAVVVAVPKTNKQTS